MSKYHGRSAAPVKKRRKPLAKRWGKDYFCTVVSEDVEIALRNKASLGRKYIKKNCLCYAINLNVNMST